MNAARILTAAFMAAAAFSATAAQPKTLYWAGGSSHIADGTPLPTTSGNLSGTWDNELRNWSVDTKGTRYVAWSNGVDRIAVLTAFTDVNNLEAQITLKTDVLLNQLRVPHNITPFAGTNPRYAFNSLEGLERTITFSGDRPMLHVFTEPNNRPNLNDTSRIRTLRLDNNVQFAAPHGLEKTGIGRVNITTPADGIYGPFLVEDGYGEQPLILATLNSSSIRNVDAFYFRNNSQFDLNWPSSQPNKFNPDAVFHLAGISRITPTGFAGNRNLRQIILGNQGVLNLQNLTSANTLTLTDSAGGIHRGADGIGTLCVESGAATLAGLIVPNGPPAGEPLPWTFSANGKPLQFNSSRRLEEAPLTQAPEDLQDWDDGLWYNLGDPVTQGAYAPFNGPLPSTTVASLGIWNNNSSGMILPIADDAALSIASGHLSMRGGGLRTITGGSLTTTNEALYILQTGGSDANNNFRIESAITGAMHVVKGGFGRVDLAGTGTNTYTGTTYVNGGVLLLDKTNNIPTIPNGLVIGGGGELQCITNGNGTKGNNLMRDDAPVTIREDGVLRFHYVNGPFTSGQVFNGAVTNNNGKIYYYRGDNPPGIVFKGPGYGLVFANGGRIEQLEPNGASLALCLLTNLRYEAASSNQALFVINWPVNAGSQRLKLSNTATPGQRTQRIFDVQDAVGLLPDQPELVLHIPLETQDNGEVELVKTGGGDMALEHFSGWFRGAAIVREGALLVNGAYATNATYYCRNVSGTGTIVRGLPSTAGIYLTQPVDRKSKNEPGYNNRVTGILNATEVNLADVPWWAAVEPGSFDNLTFIACGALGTADVTVEIAGTLGGTGGVGGNVFVDAGGTFCPGTPANPYAALRVGKDLVFDEGGTWKVRAPDGYFSTNQCNIAHVQGGITLAGECEVVFPEGKRPKGRWTIATYDVAAEGAMSAPPGCKVRIDEVNQIIELVSAEAGTLMLVR